MSTFKFEVNRWRQRLGLAYLPLRMMEVVPQVYQMVLPGSNVFLILGEELTLIDTGMWGSAPFIWEGINRLGRSPGELSRLLITHHHYDHTGNLVRLKEASGAQVAMHWADIANGLPYPVPASFLLHHPPLSALRKWLVVEQRFFDLLLRGGEILPILGGLEVIHTPGHTAGSVCYFSRKWGILFVGDLLNHSHRQVALPPRIASLNPAQMLTSLAQIAELPIETLCFGHGTPIRTGARAALLNLVGRFSSGIEQQ